MHVVRMAGVCLICLSYAPVFAQTGANAPASHPSVKAASKTGASAYHATVRPRQRSGLDLRSPTFVIAPDYGRYGYLGDGTDFGRDQAIYLSR